MSRNAIAETDGGAPAGAVPLDRRRLGLYALPMVGVNFSLVLLISYIAKYSVDVLLIAPAVIGAIVGSGRIWDAVTDPLAGYWSDRTRASAGRRRPWLLASALPIALFGLMTWSPPRWVEGPWLVLWMIVAIYGFNTAITMFLVPHQALGAELSDNYHERTRIFARRQQAGVVGLMLSLVGGISILSTVENPRDWAFWLALGSGTFCVVGIVPCAWLLKERVDYQGRGSRSGSGTVADVLRNPHARTLYTMIFVEHMGAGASMVLAPFLMAYVLNRPEMTGMIFIPYTVSQLLTISLWMRLSQRIGKKRTWIAGMGVGSVGYGLLFFVGDGDLLLMFVVVTLTGAVSACGQVIGSSILADVVDYDEARTGQRKEGAYYSLYNFLYKGSGGVMAMIAGVALQWVGFVPNAVQTEATKLVISSLMSLVPLACIVGGLLIFLRFRLTEEVHAGIRDELRQRTRGETQPDSASR